MKSCINNNNVINSLSKTFFLVNLLGYLSRTQLSFRSFRESTLLDIRQSNLNNNSNSTMVSYNSRCTACVHSSQGWEPITCRVWEVQQVRTVHFAVSV